jgi:hypothetical protein
MSVLADSIKVRPRFDARGVLLFNAVAGIPMSGPQWLATYTQTGSALFSYLKAVGLSFATLSLGMFLVPLALAITLAQRCQRARLAFWAGFAYGTAFAVSGLWALGYSGLGAVASLGALCSIPFVLALLGSLPGAVFGMGYLAVNKVFQKIRYTVQEQDGSMCWTCGYVVGDPPLADRCSECGTPVHPPIVQASPFRRLRLAYKRSASVLSTVLGLAMVACVVLPLSLQAARVGRFTKIPGGGTTAGVPMFELAPLNGTMQMVGAWEAMATLQDVPERPQMVLAICHDPSHAIGQPVIQLQLLAKPSRQGPPSEYGDPVLVCNLDQAQAQQVLDHGVPTQLVEALRDAADNAGWTPLLPTPGRFGRFILIDPSPHMTP